MGKMKDVDIQEMDRLVKSITKSIYDKCVENSKEKARRRRRSANCFIFIFTVILLFLVFCGAASK